MRKRLLIGAGSAAMLVFAAGVVLMTLALYRYGGFEGVTDRVRMQLAVEQPHDDFVPTPEATGDEPDAVMLAAAATIQLAAREASASPSATRTVIRDFLADRELEQFASLMQPSEFPVSARPAKAPSQPAATAKPRPAATDPPAARTELAAAEAQAATPVPAESGAPTSAPVFPPSARLEGLAHYWQTWNNCGPATLSMNLSYFGIKVGQDKIGRALKPEKDDKNVAPEQLADFARSQGLNALVRVNGDSTRLKALLQAGIPVIAETWYEPKPNDGMGHYRLIVGYDDASAASGEGHWIAYDSYDSHGIKRGDPYKGVHFPYDSFDKLWKVFGRTYIPIYDESRAAAVEQVLGADLDDNQMWERALAEDLAHVKANPRDAFGWFNVGTDYANLGDYKAASQAYDTARQLRLPWRMLWYQFGPFEAYYQVGRYKEVVSLANATIKTAVNDEELLYWKGVAQQALGDTAGAKASLAVAIKQRATYQDAVDALKKLE